MEQPIPSLPVTTPSLKYAWPYYWNIHHLNKQDKLEQFRKRLTRKRIFGKPASHSRLCSETPLLPLLITSRQPATQCGANLGLAALDVSHNRSPRRLSGHLQTVIVEKKRERKMTASTVRFVIQFSRSGSACAGMLSGWPHRFPIAQILAERSGDDHHRPSTIDVEASTCGPINVIN